MLHKRWIAGGLCAALVLFAAALGVQQKEINDFKKRTDNLETQLRNTGDSLNDRIDNLENNPANLVSSCSVSFAGMDLKERAVQIKVTITTDQDIQNECPEILVSGIGDVGKFSWPEPPLSYNSAEDNSYSVKLELPMDASNMELLFSAGGVSETLQTFSSVSDLLPVQLESCNGDTVYNSDRQVFYQTEWCAELSDLNVASAAFRIYKNGKLQGESPCNLEPYEDSNGKTLRCWDPADGHGTPCKTGDELEMRIFCTDEYGIQYEFPVRRWQITDTKAAALWPLTNLPTLTWPEDQAN